jgi:hypothetical protein
MTAGERADERDSQGSRRWPYSAITIPKQVLRRFSPYADDRTQTGRELISMDERLSSQPKDDPELKPTDVQRPEAGLANPYSRLDERR